MNVHGKVTGMVAALAALAVSGVVLADHSPGHGKKKEKDPSGPPATKTSVEVTNLCEPVESYYDISQGGTVSGTFLKVTSTIKNESGDGIEDPFQIGEQADVSQVQVGGLQLVKSDGRAKTKEWKPVGAVEFTPDAELKIPPGESRDYIVYLDLCRPPEYKLDVNATALNAEIQVMIKEGSEEPVRNFIGNCDDLDIDDDGDGIDDADESRIDIEDYPWLSC